MNRRTFIKRTALGVAGAGLLTGLYTWQIEPFWLEWVRMKMPIRNLPEHLVGKTCMQISDIHVGKRFDHRFIIDAFEEAKSMQPDFVVYTGDYVSTYKDKVMFDLLGEVLDHSVLGKLGTFGILGNHDYGVYWKQPEVADQIVAQMEARGIRMLRNQMAESHGLRVIGFDDLWARRCKPSLALKEYDPQLPSIVLCHNPDVCDGEGWGEYQGWILSGHTHGGQVKPPFLPPPILPVKNKRYTAGRIELSNNRTLYINRALGNIHQVRFNVRPEITIFELEQS